VLRRMRLTCGCAWAAAALLLTGCATEPGRVPGPGAFVANVGGGLVNAHDSVARALLGDAAKPMLIAPPPAAAVAVGADRRAERSAVPAAAGIHPRQAASALPVFASAADATSADLDGDGTVSVDEVVALARSGITDAEVLERLERTGRTFDLSTSQEQYLRVRGISDGLIARLRTLNHSAPPADTPRPDMAAVPVGEAPGESDSGAAAR
jgi:hypothetical protein